MSTFVNFGIEFACSLLIWWLLAQWYAWPWLRSRPFGQALLILLLPFLPRYLGLMSLTPGVVDETVTRSAFAFYQAYGDFTAWVLALIAFAMVHLRWQGALTVVWVFNTFGFVDFLHSVVRGTVQGTGGSLGAFWYIPVCYVPLGLVVHGMIFGLLIKRGKEYQPVRAEREDAR